MFWPGATEGGVECMGYTRPHTKRQVHKCTHLTFPGGFVLQCLTPSIATLWMVGLVIQTQAIKLQIISPVPAVVQPCL